MNSALFYRIYHEVWFALFILFSVASCGTAYLQQEAALIPYTEFREQVQRGNITEITVSGAQITGKFARAAAREEKPGEKAAQSDFITYIPSFGDAGLLALLQEKKVVVKTVRSGAYSLSDVLRFLPMVILFVLALWFFMRARSRGPDPTPMQQSGARLYDQGAHRTTFNDVAGAYAAKAELQEIVEFLKNPAHYQRLGGKTPRGALLVGPPGTGKTLLARAVAGEANVPFFSVSGSDFMEMYVGVGASRVRNMFAEAKKRTPSIIFIDEIDAIGRHRGLGGEGGQGEREQTLNQLLSEMDGFEPNISVIVMAATNRPDILDPALLRPGRFDRHIAVDLPPMDDRFEILKVHARNKPLEKDVSLTEIARGTPGFSGADLGNLLNEAAILAAKKGKTAIGEEDIQEARDKVLMGLERKNLSITDEERKLLAYHEGGHAVVAALLPNADPVYKVTIIPRGQAMGVTQQLPERDKVIYPKDYVLDRLAVMLGGRAAEKLIFDTATSGAESDLKGAMELTRKMVLDWGMGENLSNLALGGRRASYLEDLGQRREYSEMTAGKIDEEVRSILDEAFQRSLRTLEEHRDGLDRVAAMLIEKEEIPGSEVVRLVKQ